MDYYIGSLRPQPGSTLSIGPDRVLVTQNTGKTAWLPAKDYVPSAHYHKKGVLAATTTFGEIVQPSVDTTWQVIKGHAINADANTMIRAEWYGVIDYPDRRATAVNIPMIALAKDGILDATSIRYPTITVGHTGTSRAILTTTTESPCAITILTSIKSARAANPYTARFSTKKTGFQSWKLS